MTHKALLVFSADSGISGESVFFPGKGVSTEKALNNRTGAIEISDYGVGVSMPVTPGRSDGGGATVGRANLEVFTCSKSPDTATCKLVEHCCRGTHIRKIVLHLFRLNGPSQPTKYAMVTFQHCVITKVALVGSGEELPKELLEFSYGACEYAYQEMHDETSKPSGNLMRAGWSAIQNKEVKLLQDFNEFRAT